MPINYKCFGSANLCKDILNKSKTQDTSFCSCSTRHLNVFQNISSHFKIKFLQNKRYNGGEELRASNLFLYKNCFNKMFLISFQYMCVFKIIWRKKKRWKLEGLKDIRIKFQLKEDNWQFFLIQSQEHVSTIFPFGGLFTLNQNSPVSVYEKFRRSCYNKLPIAIQSGFHPTPKNSHHKIFTLQNTSRYCTLGFHIIPSISSITRPQSTNSALAACKQRLSQNISIQYLKRFQSKNDVVLGPVWNR